MECRKRQVRDFGAIWDVYRPLIGGSADLENWRRFTLTETPSRQQNNYLFRLLESEASGLSESGSTGRQGSSSTQRLRLVLPKLVDNGWCVSSGWGAVNEVSFTHLNCSMVRRLATCLTESLTPPSPKTRLPVPSSFCPPWHPKRRCNSQWS